MRDEFFVEDEEAEACYADDEGDECPPGSPGVGYAAPCDGD